MNIKFADVIAAQMLVNSEEVTEKIPLLFGFYRTCMGLHTVAERGVIKLPLPAEDQFIILKPKEQCSHAEWTAEIERYTKWENEETLKQAKANYALIVESLNESGFGLTEVDPSCTLATRVMTSDGWPEVIIMLRCYNAVDPLYHYQIIGSPGYIENSKKNMHMEAFWKYAQKRP